VICVVADREGRNDDRSSSGGETRSMKIIAEEYGPRVRDGRMHERRRMREDGEEVRESEAVQGRF